MTQAGFVALDFTEYFEPEGGIRTPQEFTAELLRWADREHRRLWILEESMEPLVEVDGVPFRCRLAEPALAAQNNPLRRKLGIPGINHAISPFLGYQWVYLYKVHP